MNGSYGLDYFEDSKQKHWGFWSTRCRKQEVRVRFIQKAILTGKPDSNNGNHGLVLLYNDGEGIAYYGRAGDNFWTVLDISHAPYDDIICHENNLFALGDYNSIEVWDLQQGSGCIVKKRFYLVQSRGDLLLVVRFIADDGDRETDYRIILFHVYKLDYHGRKWVEIECLGDRALFLGGNQSVLVLTRSFPDCEKNSIYFTDDSRERVEDDFFYGGHDMGICNLKYKSFKSIYEFSSHHIEPPPCWIVPPAMLEP
ncbi:hypothetical protein F3Y22_tig00112857pilonHSYRG00148 [Hibiscus syriacus]|uniref:KIB1-4 beta-propeller domain-containing protein n=1 Tax=Hibiscus syriacus TaxID=106335 RepID=A0A6A2WSY2_HIBSY|nr:hypothetical protein F3Y22_tig00112857pilonHSYRG00148 [Hibiscus syriacus]